MHYFSGNRIFFQLFVVKGSLNVYKLKSKIRDEKKTSED